MGKLSIPSTRKLFGFNLVPKKEDIYGGVAWEHMIQTWDWDNWIKPQIDLHAGNYIGCNALRMIGGCYGIAAGLYTQDFYDARWRQLADYCAQLGIYLYPSCTGKGTLNNSTVISNDGIANIFATSLLKLQAYSNIIGVDVVQEANVNAAPSDANLIDILRRVRAAGVTLPLTCSSGEINVASAATAPWLYAMGQHFDFVDIHNYTYPITMQSFDGVLAAFPDKDILVGEWGRPQSIAEAQRLADLKQILELMNSGERRIRGGLRWAATDQDTLATNQWGDYDVSFVPRLAEVNLLRRYTGGSVAALERRVA